MRPESHAKPLIVYAHAGADWIAGAERCLLDLLAGLDRDRFRAMVVCNAPVLAAEVERGGTEAVLVPRWPRGAIGAIRMRGTVHRLLASRGAALVHANMARTLPVMYPAAHRLQLPLLTHLHLPFSSLTDFHQYLVQHGSAVVGVAQHVVAPIRSAAMPRDRVRVIFNAVDHARLTSGDARGLRSELRIPPTAITGLSIGSLIARKGHDVSLRGLAAARRWGLDARLLICGSGDGEAGLRSLAEQLGVERHVHFLGYRRDVGAVLRDAADVLVASAREEALPLNVLEAQWLGVPVIASDIAGHREALCPAAGIFVAPEDAEALAAAMRSLAGDPARREAMRAAGRAFAATRFTMEAYVHAFEDLYAELLRPPPGHAPGGGAWPPTTAAWIRATLGRRARKARARWSPRGWRLRSAVARPS